MYVQYIFALFFLFCRVTEKAFVAGFVPSVTSRIRDDNGEEHVLTEHPGSQFHKDFISFRFEYIEQNSSCGSSSNATFADAVIDEAHDSYARSGVDIALQQRAWKPTRNATEAGLSVRNGTGILYKANVRD